MEQILNLQYFNQILIQEVMEFWLNLGVDGFFMPNVRSYLSVDRVRGRMNNIARGKKI